MVQAYLCLDPERVVRVRISGNQAWLTVKGGAQGAVRVEFEFEVPVQDAEGMLAMSLPGTIEKTRHEIRVGCHVWEVDEFSGDNAGLVVAEIELSDEHEAFDRPDWLGREVTHESRYTNACLARWPYATWEQGVRDGRVER